MIIVIDKGDLTVNAYSTMVKACKARKWSYSYLKNQKLSSNPFSYKTHYIYKVRTADILSL